MKWAVHELIHKEKFTNNEMTKVTNYNQSRAQYITRRQYYVIVSQQTIYAGMTDDPQ